MNIRWEPYVWKEPHPVESAEIDKLEAAWNIQLPEEYKQIAPRHHGMMPRPNTFDVGQSGNVFTCLLTLTSGKHEKAYAISTLYGMAAAALLIDGKKRTTEGNDNGTDSTAADQKV